MALGSFKRLILGANLTGTDNGDETITIDAAGGGGSTDGWTAAGVTWTYASGSGGGLATFTASGDLTAVYSKGTRIKLTQTTVKYFVVTTSSHAAGTTTVSIMAGTDYTLANAAITAPHYSYAANPQGYPGWFNWAIAPTGFSSVTVSFARFCVFGSLCSIVFFFTGTSNATTMAFTLPIAAARISALIHPAYATDNNTALADAALINNAAATTAVQVYKTLAVGAWTASAMKTLGASITYEI